MVVCGGNGADVSVTTECYGVLIEGRKPRFYEKLSTAKQVASWYRGEGFGRIAGLPEPVIKEYIMGMEVRLDG